MHIARTRRLPLTRRARRARHVHRANARPYTKACCFVGRLHLTALPRCSGKVLCLAADATPSC
eukprot:6205917-Pleurochrysis_carterae.AAC.2